MIFNVSPIYGNGWTDGIQTIEEPDAFRIETKQNSAPDKLLGTVLTTGHHFFGWDFEASPRYHGGDNEYDCNLSTASSESEDKKRHIYGYCRIS